MDAQVARNSDDAIEHYMQAAEMYLELSECARNYKPSAAASAPPGSHAGAGKKPAPSAADDISALLNDLPSVPVKKPVAGGAVPAVAAISSNAVNGKASIGQSASSNVGASLNAAKLSERVKDILDVVTKLKQTKTPTSASAKPSKASPPDPEQGTDSGWGKATTLNIA